MIAMPYRCYDDGDDHALLLLWRVYLAVAMIETDRQAEKQAVRDRQTDRQRQRGREREREKKEFDIREI